ncbi:uncharacterized protein LOC102154740 isoform X9 [Canis lupus familiaris]|uniref:uncharacterized protein LOC102154740 isoform X9 n=1 Tax=Canis lupus familiaris TaxID=9615 RepID=UPI000DC68DC9|nr:uncharacterized protein LOC102154740 isoform X9 [Canis lupus familiaris]
MQNKHRSPGFRLVSRLSAALYRYRSTVPPASPRPLVPVEVCGVTRDLANLTSCRQMRPLLVWGLRPGPDLPRGPVGVLGAQRETSLSAGPEPSVGSAPHGNGRYPYHFILHWFSEEDRGGPVKTKITKIHKRSQKNTIRIKTYQLCRRNDFAWP